VDAVAKKTLAFALTLEKSYRSQHQLLTERAVNEDFHFGGNFLV